jgi:hypothetical protein
MKFENLTLHYSINRITYLFIYVYGGGGVVIHYNVIVHFHMKGDYGIIAL